MAEKKAADKEPQPDSADGGGKRKKLLLIGGGAALLVLVLGVLAGWLLLGGKEDDAGAEEASEPVHAEPAIYVALGEKFIVTLPGAGKPHHFQVGVSALTREQAVAEEIKFNTPLLRDRLDSLFARQSFDALRTEEGKLALRAEVLQTVQGILAEVMHGAAGEAADEGGEADGKAAGSKKGEAAAPTGGVEQVFFTEFVLQ
jgi:flagellar FliL protein